MYERLVNLIEDTEITKDPFPFLYIEDFLEQDFLDQVVTDPLINQSGFLTDEALIEGLTSNGWSPIPFPGTTKDIATYLEARRDHGRGDFVNELCEGAGVTFRLAQIPADGPIRNLIDFFASDEFWGVAAARFGKSPEGLEKDYGIQKYLDGYEISPHPDIRKKSLTFMLNINPSQRSEEKNIHTHYMKMKEEFEGLYGFWENNPDAERTWVPWNWAETVFRQVKNNSLVIFSPSDRTMHAVKADYDHLEFQRTQVYGNLWESGPRVGVGPKWDELARLL